MSIVKIAEEAGALQKIWNDLTGCSIAWEIENTNLDEICVMDICKQGVGTRHGSWDDIPKGNCEECGTQHDTIIGTGNLGGVVYELQNGVFFGVIWADPSIGSSQYGYCMGGKADVEAYVKKWWDTWFTCLEISSGESKTINWGGVTAKIQPGFDPFKISFSVSTDSELDSTETFISSEVTEISSSELPKKVITSEQLALMQQSLGKTLLESGRRLRGNGN